MRLSYGEVESLRGQAYALALEAAIAEDFEIGGLTFEIRKEIYLADLVSDEVTQKIRSNIQWALDKDE